MIRRGRPRDDDKKNRQSAIYVGFIAYPDHIQALDELVAAAPCPALANRSAAVRMAVRWHAQRLRVRARIIRLIRRAVSMGYPAKRRRLVLVRALMCHVPFWDPSLTGPNLRSYIKCPPAGDDGGYVYFVIDETSQVVKIGYTAREPINRFEELQTGYPNKLRFAGCVRGDRATEKEFHRQFEAQRLRYEWFRYEGELAAFIETLPASAP